MSISAMPHKRPRRTRAEMDRIRDALIALSYANRPLTVRQLFYLAVSAGVIDKTEDAYKHTVVRLALELRQSGAIPWDWVVDRTRFYFRPTTFDSLAGALADQARFYRRSLWTDATCNVQVWCESMSVAGIINPETDEWDVPLYPCRGYASHDFLRTAARLIADAGKDTVIYLLGDYDPSGQDIIRFVSNSVRLYADEVDPAVRIGFHTIAVTPEQIRGLSLPSHPAKRTDTRHSRYRIDEAVELEAIPPDRLRLIVRESIVSHLDPEAIARVRAVEQAERETLARIALKGGVA